MNESTVAATPKWRAVNSEKDGIVVLLDGLVACKICLCVDRNTQMVLASNIAERMNEQDAIDLRSQTVANHTPGPWRISGEVCHEPSTMSSAVCIDTENPLYTGYLSCVMDIRSNEHHDIEANARRVVACVNACEGIDDPTDMRKQRDELLNALKDMNEASLVVLSTYWATTGTDDTVEYEALEELDCCYGESKKLIAKMATHEPVPDQ